jgi:hypothetical protein
MQAQSVIPPGARLYGTNEEVELSAVYGGSTNAEDNTYARATPTGRLQLQIDNPSAQGFFKPGKKYYVDISEVPEETPATKS